MGVRVYDGLLWYGEEGRNGGTGPVMSPGLEPKATQQKPGVTILPVTGRGEGRRGRVRPKEIDSPVICSCDGRTSIEFRNGLVLTV